MQMPAIRLFENDEACVLRDASDMGGAHSYAG
jgi:hypothetical protein